MRSSLRLSGHGFLAGLASVPLAVTTAQAAMAFRDMDPNIVSPNVDFIPLSTNGSWYAGIAYACVFLFAWFTSGRDKAEPAQGWRSICAYLCAGAYLIAFPWMISSTLRDTAVGVTLLLVWIVALVLPWGLLWRHAGAKVMLRQLGAFLCVFVGIPLILLVFTGFIWLAGGVVS